MAGLRQWHRALEILAYVDVAQLSPAERREREDVARGSARARECAKHDPVRGLSPAAKLLPKTKRALVER
jgi:hypothetical protein